VAAAAAAAVDDDGGGADAGAGAAVTGGHISTNESSKRKSGHMRQKSTVSNILSSLHLEPLPSPGRLVGWSVGR
jgi:hypothetical protein